MHLKLLFFAFCSMLVISCSDEKVVLKTYSDDKIKLEWFHNEFLFQTSNDFIEIVCKKCDNYLTKTMLSIPKGWITRVEVNDKKIIMNHNIEADILDKIISQDSIYGYEIILKEVN